MTDYKQDIVVKTVREDDISHPVLLEVEDAKGDIALPCQVDIHGTRSFEGMQIMQLNE